MTVLCLETIVSCHDTIVFGLKLNLFPHRILTTVAVVLGWCRLKLLLMFRDQKYKENMRWTKFLPTKLKSFILNNTFRSSNYQLFFVHLSH